MLAVDEDILGVYLYDSGDVLRTSLLSTKASTPHLLGRGWSQCPNGWVALWKTRLSSSSPTSLRTLILSFGADINGRRWPSPIFAKSETGLKEGLAQYYTYRLLRRLERRYSGALKAYEAMLPGQPPACSHPPAVDRWSTPEAVRRAMARNEESGKETKLVDFNRRLIEANKELQPTGTVS